jgi:hypothetical protein
MRVTKLFAVAMAVGLVASLQIQSAGAHSGGTNADGCHTNHKTGDYHCHTPKLLAPDRVSYCHVINGESRCGYARSSCANLVSQFGGSCRQQ